MLVRRHASTASKIIRHTVMAQKKELRTAPFFAYSAQKTCRSQGWHKYKYKYKYKHKYKYKR